MYDPRAIPAAKLAKLIATLPEDCLVAPNSVYNLAILIQAPDSDEWEQIGHIDVPGEAIEIYDERFTLRSVE